jgi:regulator of protease activity HflC (stomatin/prohibitin superfamily)
VILRLGAYARTEVREGLHAHLPWSGDGAVKESLPMNPKA